ncbi:MAG: hypothetical protein H6706_00275 [Myxococcales bacterium]|nr:hypothetical protein [Myxococcales bacterium]
MRPGLAAVFLAVGLPAQAQLEVEPQPAPEGGGIAAVLTRLAQAALLAEATRSKAGAVEGAVEQQGQRLNAMAGAATRIETRCEGPNELAVIRICDAGDACTELAYSCAPTRCIDGLCGPPSCTSNADCAADASCNTQTGACIRRVQTSICTSEFVVTDGQGVDTSCSPYKCYAGHCRSECLTTTDCADDYECYGQKCVAIRHCAAPADCGAEGWDCIEGVCRPAGPVVNADWGWGQ